MKFTLSWLKDHFETNASLEDILYALTDLGERGVVDLDEDRKAAMVSNLLVVLCADREAQPVVNTGTLYG